MEKMIKYIKRSYSNMSYEERHEIVDYIMNNNIYVNKTDNPDLIDFIKDMCIHINKINDEYFKKYKDCFYKQFMDIYVLPIDEEEIDCIENFVVYNLNNKELKVFYEIDYINEDESYINVPMRYIDDKIVHEEIMNKIINEYDFIQRKIAYHFNDIKNLLDKKKKFDEKLNETCFKKQDIKQEVKELANDLIKYIDE